MRNLKSILLVEDDNVDVMAIKRAFKELEIVNKLIPVVNGEEALVYLRDENNEKPSLILLDLNTPKIDGIEFLRIIKSDEKLVVIPVVVLTTSNNQCDIVECFKNGVAGYMVKSVDYGNFVEKLRIINEYWSLSELPSEDEITAAGTS